jgi:thioester reductase-like protein
MVAGDSRKGIGDLDDFIFRVFKGSLQIGCVPELDAKVNALPVDCISNAIIGFSLQKESLGQVFHLVHPHPVRIDTLLQWIREKGYKIDRVPWEIWRQKLGEASEDNAIYPLLPMFPETLDEAEDHGEIVFDVTNSLTMFQKIGYRIPSIDGKLLNTYYAYLTGVGYIPQGASGQ